MNNLGYYNGKIGLIEEMSVPMTDRAFYFGDGVYEAVLCRNNIPYLLSVHIKRLFKNCEILDIIPPIEDNELFGLICDLVKKVDSVDKFIYFHVSRGSGLRAHTYERTKGNICIMITPFLMGNVYEKVDTVTYNENRYGFCNIKTLNLIPSILAAQYAKDKGCDEAIFVREGVVTEGSHCNISIIKSNEIITHPDGCHILPGVAKSELLRCAKKHGVSVSERKYGIEELISADEIVLTSSGKIIRAVKSIDGISVGGKSNELLTLFQDEMYGDFVKTTSLQ